MQIIDEEGQLFGTINVVDALVVLLVIAVGLAGFALVTSGGSSTEDLETRHVTLDLGTQPESLVEEIDVGDTDSMEDESGNVTITDAYFTTAESGSRAIVRAAVTGPERDGSVTVGDEPLRIGRSLHFENSVYSFNGTVRNVGNESTLPTRERTVVLRGTVPSDVADQITADSDVRVAGTTVATVDDVATYGADSPDRRTLFLNATLRGYVSGDFVRFGDTPLQSGQSLTLPVAGYQFNGTIDRVGSGFERSSQNLLVQGNVSAEVAREIETGDAYQVAGQPIATVENVAVYGTDDPDRKRVYVGLSVQALHYGEVPRFGANRPIRDGATLPFRTPAYEFDGEIVRLGASNEPGESSTRAVTLEMQNVAPDRANSVHAGLTESNAERTVAEITDVQVDPAIVTLTSESGDIFEREHPVNKTVTLSADLSVRDRDAGVRFKGRTLQEGNQVTLDLGTTTIDATVTDIGGE